MVITINIYYTGKNGSAKAFAKEMIDLGIVADIRKEEGNLRYEYYTSFNDPETILLIDRWINQEALDAHHNSKMMQKIIELRNKYDLTMKVERFVDDVDIPKIDEKFIRK